MKASSKIVSIIGLSAAISAVAFAEPFNQRGNISFAAPSQSYATVQVSAPIPLNGGFNDRGGLFADKVPFGSFGSYTRAVATVSGGFNDRVSYFNPSTDQGDRFGGAYFAQIELNR